VGYRVVSEAIIMGGSTLTLSDVSTRAGRLTGMGDAALAAGVDQATVDAAIRWVDEQVQTLCDRMKASHADVPLIAVGGGSHLVPDQVEGVSAVIKPPHFAVANAYGAAIAEASGEVDRVYRYDSSSREACLADAKQLAIENAVRAGADPGQVRITAVAEIPMSYVPGGGCRVHVKAAGPLAAA
jgi:hypothetical protein